ncbi:hypothetical protein SAMN05216456_1904 [Devosia crocina]|uniref:Uncharacterized protein n=1 Tax=Devosia crocina TaxID=429728 RepID=A0A1I7NET8_9HYPH|nr:hypothetical protein [Devosia crocina]SFV33159.1 hypothetical protein SAMN05216456_1904 [Devosia crocina]
MRYNDRSLHSVALGLFETIEADGEKLVSTTVYVTLSSADGKGAGPGIQINLAFEADETTSFATAKAMSTKLAYEMIQRLARETPETFTAAADKEPIFRTVAN